MLSWRIGRQRGSQQVLKTWGGKTEGITRAEFEFEIPVDDANSMIKMCESYISKTRYLYKVGKHTWEVDTFHGLNSGLVIAEIELEYETEEFEIPSWVLEDVSDDYRYFNNNLLENPYSIWKKKAN